jgi:hypothetical protein
MDEPVERLRRGHVSELRAGNIQKQSPVAPEPMPGKPETPGAPRMFPSRCGDYLRYGYATKMSSRDLTKSIDKSMY